MSAERVTFDGYLEHGKHWPWFTVIVNLKGHVHRGNGSVVEEAFEKWRQQRAPRSPLTLAPYGKVSFRNEMEYCGGADIKKIGHLSPDGNSWDEKAAYDIRIFWETNLLKYFWFLWRKKI